MYENPTLIKPWQIFSIDKSSIWCLNLNILSTHLYSIYSVIIIQPLPEYESYKFHFHCRNNLLDNYHVATPCHFSYLKVAGKEKFPGVLSWTAQQRRRTWSGNSLLKAGRSLSCGEQSAKLVLHPLLLTGPISSGPCFFFFFALKVRKKKRKKLQSCSEEESSLWINCLQGSGAHGGKHLPCWFVYLLCDLAVEAV